jgi:dihydropteroate synthase
VINSSGAAWRVRDHLLNPADHTLVMGVVNVTPDSFSDGGAFAGTAGTDHEAAIAHGSALWSEGADIVDVGGESTRPGAAAVPADEEMARVVPVIAALTAAGVVVSVDTSKPEVAAAALEAGAHAVNDVTAFGHPDMARVCADADAGAVLMHMKGTPRTMQDNPTYGDVVGEVADYLRLRAEAAVAAGVAPDHLCLDPGIGFGKTFDHNLELLARLDELVKLGYPLLVGTSRKRFLGMVLGDAGLTTEPADRDPATAATVALAVSAGAAGVRVHDVNSAVQSARVADAIVRTSLTSRRENFGRA